MWWCEATLSGMTGGDCQKQAHFQTQIYLVKFSFCKYCEELFFLTPLHLHADSRKGIHFQKAPCSKTLNLSILVK